MTEDATIACFHITGQATEPATVEAVTRVMRNAMQRFEQHFQRLPTDDESDMLWAAVQRYFGIPESAIEPPAQRRQ
jgi:collagenase-like PrtC family protease